MGARKRSQVEQARADLKRWAEDGAIATPIDKVFEFDEVPELMGRLIDGAMTGKIILRGPSN